MVSNLLWEDLSNWDRESTEAERKYESEKQLRISKLSQTLLSPKVLLGHVTSMVENPIPLLGVSKSWKATAEVLLMREYEVILGKKPANIEEIRTYCRLLILQGDYWTFNLKEKGVLAESNRRDLIASGLLPPNEYDRISDYVYFKALKLRKIPMHIPWLMDLIENFGIEKMNQENRQYHRQGRTIKIVDVYRSDIEIIKRGAAEQRRIQKKAKRCSMIKRAGLLATAGIAVLGAVFAKFR